MRGATLDPWRKLKTKIDTDDDVVALDADAKDAIVVLSHDASGACDGAVATSVHALRIDRRGTGEGDVELAPAVCGTEVGPLLTGDVGGKLVVAWAERRAAGQRRKERADRRPRPPHHRRQHARAAGPHLSPPRRRDGRRGLRQIALLRRSPPRAPRRAPPTWSPKSRRSSRSRRATGVSTGLGSNEPHGSSDRLRSSPPFVVVCPFLFSLFRGRAPTGCSGRAGPKGSSERRLHREAVGAGADHRGEERDVERRFYVGVGRRLGASSPTR